MTTHTANETRPVDAAANPTPRILVWDLPTRVFHWSLAICFAGAWLTSESERQSLLHLLFGYSVLGLILFRLVWGFAGSRYARFAEFFHGPGVTWRYIASMAKRRPAHYVGHNPAGAVAIWLLLGLGLTTAGVGVAMVVGGGESLEDIHEALATAMLVIVGLHLLGVIAGSLSHRENLPRAMVTGRKTGLRPEDGILGSSPVIGVALLLTLSAFWATGLSLRQPPLGLPGGAAKAADADGALSQVGADAISDKDESGKDESGKDEPGKDHSDENEEDED